MWLKTFCVQKSTHCVSVWDSTPLKVIEELNRADSPLLPPGFWSLNSGARLSAWSVWCSTVTYLVVGRRWLLFLSTALKKICLKAIFLFSYVCAHLHVVYAHICGCPCVQKMMSDPLELEVPWCVLPNMDAGNRTLILCRSCCMAPTSSEHSNPWPSLQCCCC